MTRDDINRLIQDNGLFHGTVSIGVIMDINHLEKFAALVAVAEREPLLEALTAICVKCRSNEWGPDTPRREWVGLTGEECVDAIDEDFDFGLDNGNVSNAYVIRYARAIETKLKEKNA